MAESERGYFLQVRYQIQQRCRGLQYIPLHLISSYQTSYSSMIPCAAAVQGDFLFLRVSWCVINQKCELVQLYIGYLDLRYPWFCVYTAVVLKKLFWKHHTEQADTTWFCCNQFDSKLCENIQTAIVVAIYITFWQICFQFLRFEYI